MRNKFFYTFYLLLTLFSMRILAQQKAHNPIIFADVPDLSMIRVGDTY